MKRIILLLLFSLGLQAGATPKWLDQSHEIFLTARLNSLASHYRDFPLFWWNFFILEGEPSREDIEKLCADLASDGAIQKMPCHFDLKNLQSLTGDWLKDVPLREPLPAPPLLAKRMDEGLLKAGLPMGRALVDLLRLDPLDQLAELRRKLEKRMQMDLKLEGGLLVDTKSGRKLLPAQFTFPPSESERSQQVMNTLQERCRQLPGCKSLDLFGPHSSTRENEARIRTDLETVSWTGMLALFLLCGFIVLTRRQRLLNLVPFLFFSIGVTIGVTVLVFGKIHGITLAFGPGIVGLSMDYGIHSAFLDPRSKKTWRANWVGLLTTTIIMIVLGFSTIPLLRQMMFFSVFGLCFNYLIFYLVMPRWPQWFETKLYEFNPQRWRFLTGASILFLLCTVLVFFKPLHLEIQHLNFETPRTAQLRQWFFETTGATSPYILTEDKAAPLDSSMARKTWAGSEDILYDGIANYLPPVTSQQQNLVSWRERLCTKPITPPFNESQTKFYAPFFASVACDRLQPNPLTQRIPDYLRDFSDGQNFVGLFFPSSPEQTAKLKAQYPQSSTPREIFASFPHILYAELLWMVPLAFCGAFFFLWLHYRDLGWSTLAVIPFLTGLGCYGLVITLFHLPLSFISLIGLLMVFGCSLDYGVFVMDFLLFRKENRAGVWSALTLCSFATIAGFAPLVFARHPVLNDLGQALLWGTVGTWIGSLWGIPFVHELIGSKRRISA